MSLACVHRMSRSPRQVSWVIIASVSPHFSPRAVGGISYVATNSPPCSFHFRHGKSRRNRYRPEEDGIQIGARSGSDPVYRIPISDEKRLTKFILRNYARNGKGGRPIINSSLPMPVKFGLAMIQMGLDERDNTLTTSVWCRYVRNYISVINL